MPSTRGKLLLFLFVCVAGVLVGGLFGSLAPWLYSLLDVPQYLFTTGIVFGGMSGLLAGVLWCFWFLRKIQSPPPYHSVVGRGTLFGVLVGILATVILHAGLMLAAERWAPDALASGLMFGIPAGGLLGAVCVGGAWGAFRPRNKGEAGP